MPKTSKLGIPFKSGTPEYQRAWRALNPDKVKASDNKHRESSREGAWRRRYGITREIYNTMLKSQQGVCAICWTPDPGRNHEYFHVDHDHTTNKIRGLLCDLCNRGLGYFRDSSDILESATEYLYKHENS
jgi:hypothetical protein